MTKAAKKLWQKEGTSLAPEVTDYIINDLAEDDKLLPYDVQGSIAHAKMLGAQNLLSAEEVVQITHGLEDIKTRHANGNFKLTPEQEDMHTAIEMDLTEQLGATGKKVHVGRSRNDQVLTAIRLYALDQLHETKASLIETAEAMLSFAKEHEFVPLPGYTHMQHAMPSSIGQWMGAFIESLINDASTLEAASKLNNQNPLGSGSGFGTGVPLDREMTTKELGIERVQINAIYCQNSRGKIEAFTISSLLQIMMTLGKFANDMIIFYSQEFGYIKVNPAMTTGSSIMPQKRNLDIMETLRANVSVVQSLQIQCQTASLNLISGYNRDSQPSKKALIDSFEITQNSLAIVALLLQNIAPNEERIRAALQDKDIFATDYANDLVMEGMAFRDAYKHVGENLSDVELPDIDENIRSKTHLGATGNLQLDHYESLLKKL